MNEAEFMELLGESFKHVTILKQWVRPSIFIGTHSLANEGSVQVRPLSKSDLADTPVGFVAICSHQPFPAPAPLCLFETSVDFNWETLETEHKLNRLRFKNHQWLSKFQRLEHQCQALDTAKNWFAEQNEALQGVIAANDQRVRELQECNTWSTSQRDAWEAIATERDQQIQGLQDSNAWLLSQRDAWETLAKERDKQIQEVQDSNAWLLSQRDAWEIIAKERDKQIQELQDSNAWLLSQRDAWEALAGHRDRAYQDTLNQLTKLQSHPLVRAINFLTGKKLFKP
jgi:PIN domain nuclease of toxin-antitoxin system